MYIINY